MRCRTGRHLGCELQCKTVSELHPVLPGWRHEGAFNGAVKGDETLFAELGQTGGSQPPADSASMNPQVRRQVPPGSPLGAKQIDIEFMTSPGAAQLQLSAAGSNMTIGMTASYRVPYSVPPGPRSLMLSSDFASRSRCRRLPQRLQLLTAL